MRDLVEICHDRPPRLIALGFAISKLRSASPSLAWSCTQYAISGGEGAATIGCSGGFAAAVAAAVGCGCGGHTYGMRKRGEFGIFFVIL